MLELYGLKNCGTCQKAMAWLGTQSIAFDFIDYRDHPIAPERLRQWASQLGGWEKLVNRASMTWRNLTDDQKGVSSDGQWLVLIAQYPALVRRPLFVLPDGRVSTGFNEKRIAQQLGLG